MASPRTRRLTALMIALALFVGACSSGGDELSGDEGGSGTTAAPLPGGVEGFTPDPIEWGDCPTGSDAECATVRVPLDYAAPDGELIDIAVLRVPASGDRIGALFVNPGGPGGEARDFARQLTRLLPDALPEHFDIVGVDPRGVGASTPLRCGVPPAELYAADPTIEDQADEDALIDVSKRFDDDCAIKGSAMLPHMGTRDVARDMDAVRGAMGEETLSYLGFSYGTAIGQVYADQFPTHVRAMVIDGVMQLGIDGLQRASEQADGFELALRSFTEDCDADSDCPIGPDSMKAVERLIADSEQPGGVPAPGASRPMGPGEVNLGVGVALYSQSSWTILQEAVASALDGDGTQMVLLADFYLEEGSFPVYFAVDCLDDPWPTDPQAVLDAGKATAAHAPHFGEAIVTDYVRCTMWGTPPQPIPAITAPGTPPIIVVSTTNDPATPYAGGVAVAETLENGVLVTNVGEGHGALTEGKPCLDDIAEAYFVDLQPPPDGTRCE